MHRRKAIRDAIVTALQTGGGLRVTRGNPYPETVGSLPVALVVTGEEAAEEDESRMGDLVTGKWLQIRSCVFSVECKVATTADEGPTGGLDDDLDALSLTVEQRLGADMTLGGACDKIEYQGSDASDLTGDLEAPVGVRVLAYLAIYRVDARDPQALEA